MTRRMGPTGEWVAWAGAERTENMYCMSVTLEVSKVSGWLNAFVFCRVQRGAWDAGDVQSAGGRRPVGGSGKHVGAAQLEDWAGAEPHLKHVFICVTRDVLILSNWLNAFVLCRVQRQA